MSLSLVAAGLFCVAGLRSVAVAREPFLPTSPEVVSTVPANGDQNPYGVAFVPRDLDAPSGSLKQGDILVANFNNAANLQGTGTTIVRVPTTGPVTTFFTTPSPTLGGPGTGLSTALAILHKGFVIVGSVPSSDGTAATSNAGSLLVIDAAGNLLSTITDPTINGPWDMTVLDRGNTAIAFVANVFAGTVVRLDLAVGANSVTVTNKTVIASGYQHRPDAVAFAVGPTGLVYDWRRGELYVASTEDNAVYAVPAAAVTTQNNGKGRLVYSDAAHLHGPLGMAEAPNGDLLVSNSDVINPDPNQTSEIVEFTKEGKFVTELSVDPAPGGSFGLAVQSKRSWWNRAWWNRESDRDSAIFAAVDDNAGTLMIWPASE